MSEIVTARNAMEYMSAQELSDWRALWVGILVDPRSTDEQVVRAKAMVHYIAAEQHRRWLYIDPNEGD